ncbi:hypothetical protein [Archangium sp.]|uniref:hypothetical protein n=1 Tax=Archangium sp. TaxID=1872627 RepID=UPI00389A2E82
MGFAVRESYLEAWFPTFDGPIGYEPRDLELTVGDEVAFSTSLHRLGGSKEGTARALGPRDRWVP